MPRAVLAALCLLAPASALAADWTVAEDASRVAFVSVKNGETAETHAFGGLSGKVASDGAATIAVILGSVDTGVDIRDSRMREVLFEIGRHPLAVIQAETDPRSFAALEVGTSAATRLELDVTAHGASARYATEAVVTRLGEDRVSVSPVEPIVVQAGDFGFLAGIEALREMAGLDSISPRIPVTFEIVLER